MDAIKNGIDDAQEFRSRGNWNEVKGKQGAVGARRGAFNR
ncbi:hypothetical protein SAMN00120144_3791 [Hymenobacter roseosalivarius DSM 11622]|uniref:Uncharacterized protein n=1 Tax=Hymenobacter roseosalivarius DSM 11622 TaxID=645990 RepID=A0A1W1W063_9BACT|nr:hypothetical protein SAMN00120144_3791 [Hymenobacter roseosalivarius DSM 11622]